MVTAEYPAVTTANYSAAARADFSSKFFCFGHTKEQAINGWSKPRSPGKQRDTAHEPITRSIGDTLGKEVTLKAGPWANTQAYRLMGHPLLPPKYNTPKSQMLSCVVLPKY
jgi:hypothetical protein